MLGPVAHPESISILKKEAVKHNTTLRTTLYIWGGQSNNSSEKYLHFGYENSTLKTLWEGR